MPSRKSLVEMKTCLVCGAPARIYNYGALTCPSCKTFFRRHGFRIQKNLRCQFDSQCLIDNMSRSTCTACRFAKCLAVGMLPDMIRKEDLSHSRQKPKYSVQLAEPKPLNLLVNDQSLLTSSHWTSLSNIVHAFERFSIVPQIDPLLKLFRVKADLELSVTFLTWIYSSLESIICSTPDFRIMTTAEQCSLIQRNAHGLWAIYSVLTFGQVGIFDNEKNQNAVLPLYGPINVARTGYLTCTLDPDWTVIRLFIITLTFSSNNFTVNNEKNSMPDSLLRGTFRLLGSQNVYAELLWNYLLYRYGYEHSVRRMTALIKTMLDSMLLASDINGSNEVHHNLYDEVTEKTERLLIVGEHEKVPLWGKSERN